MTDRLVQLLDDAAAALDVPLVDPDAVVARGRRLRRRHRRGAGLGILALAGGVSAVVVVALGPGASPDPIATDGGGSYVGGGAFSVGSTLHVGDTGDHTVALDGSVQSLVYTSAGVLVGSSEPASSVGCASCSARATPSAPGDDASSYALVTPDGDVRPLLLDLDDLVPGTSPDSPYLAWASAVEGDPSSWEVRVADVRTGDVVASDRVDGTFAWGGWQAPPVSIDGDTVYVGLDDRTATIDWHTGTVGAAPLLDGSQIPVVAGDHAMIRDSTAHTITVLDVATGRRLLKATGDQVAASLSPDGRYVKVWYEYESFDEDGTVLNPDTDYEVHDLATGRTTTFTTGAPWDVGWTPDGHRLRVTPHGAQVCAPTADTCETSGADVGQGRVRIGGSSYGS